MAEPKRPDVTFQRKDPQTYVVLISRAGPEGVLIGTQHFKPAGTEFATELDLFEAGYLPEGLLVSALKQLEPELREQWLDLMVKLTPEESEPLAERVARHLRKKLTG